MNIFREIPPTAGFPFYISDLFSSLKTQRYGNCLEEDFKNYLKVNYAKVTYSGTVALYIILESLKELSSKKTVVIPSYICPLVPLAIHRAGLKIKVCDIESGGFNFNLEELTSLCLENDILAIIPVHLGGIPLEFTAIEKITKKYGIFIIEDCAQSLGAEYRGKKVGTLGDFSFFSLCRGKGLTIYEGGVAVTKNEEFGVIIDNKIRQLIKSNFFSEAIKVLELFGYWIFYRPCLFWFIFRLPQIFWKLQGKEFKAQQEEFNVDFPMHRVSNFRKLIGHLSFNRLEEEIRRQQDIAAYYIEGLKRLKGIRVIEASSEDRGIYPYLTLLFDDIRKRNYVLEIFKNSGLGVSIIYASAITDYPYLKEIVPYRDCSGARALAKRAITLSTNTFLKTKDLECILKMIKNAILDYSLC
jgi:dTDP-4-amino-4,6-dideoxygalactose transaminase